MKINPFHSMIRRALGVGQRASNAALVLLGVWLCCLVAGCASTGSIVASSHTSSAGTSRHESVSVETISDVPDCEPQRKLLNALIASGLQQNGRFKRVTGSVSNYGSAPDLKVTARIKDLRGVSDVARVMVGAFAGRAGLVVSVVITDQKTGARISTFQATGNSSAGWAGAGTTDQAIQRVAEQIVAEVLKVP